MKQLLILSGKGGTGKTTLAGTFAQISHARAIADCDVDAPNLHLVLSFKGESEVSEYLGMGRAFIDQDVCVSCGLCHQHCAYDAIECIQHAEAEKKEYRIGEYGCEGCGVCEYVCPANAISMVQCVDGYLELYKNERIFSTATLKMGSGTSGKLVSEVKKNLLKAAPKEGMAILDGSPGIGCPVIASISGVHMVLVVAEPSVSGLSDLQRIIKTARNFQTPVALCINKFDTNEEKAREIEVYCTENTVPLVGKIPFDSMVVEAVNQGRTMAQMDGPAAKAMKATYEKTMEVFWRNQK